MLDENIRIQQAHVQLHQYFGSDNSAIDSGSRDSGDPDADLDLDKQLELEYGSESGGSRKKRRADVRKGKSFT